MALETGTYVNDLVITNPPGTDLKSQGDDHLQLIKKVLKNTFPNATRAFPLPVAVPLTVSTTVLGTQQNALILVNNGAAMNLTMPALVTADAGWSVSVLKLPGSSGPIFVTPPSGTIFSGQTSVAKARRNIPGIPFQVIWTGSNWVCERCINAPVGSIIPFFTTSLPIGFEWPNGQTLVTTDYPEYASIRGSGTTPNLKQRSLFGTNLGGSDPNLINVGRSGIDPTVIESGGGLDTVTLVRANLPNVTLGGTGSGSVSLSTHNHGFTFDTFTFALGPGSQQVVTNVAASGGNNSVSTANTDLGSPTVTVSSITTDSINNNVTQTNVNKMPPAITTNYALVVE